MPVNRSKTKLTVRKLVESLGQTLPLKDLAELSQWFRQKQTLFEEQGFSNLELSFDDGGFDSPHELAIYGTREETDEEFATRQREISRLERVENGKLERHRKYIAEEAKKLGIVA